MLAPETKLSGGAWVSAAPMPAAAARQTLLSPSQWGKYLVFWPITSFVKGDVNFQPKDNH